MGSSSSASPSCPTLSRPRPPTTAASSEAASPASSRSITCASPNRSSSYSPRTRSRRGERRRCCFYLDDQDRLGQTRAAPIECVRRRGRAHHHPMHRVLLHNPFYFTVYVLAPSTVVRKLFACVCPRRGRVCVPASREGGYTFFKEKKK